MPSSIHYRVRPTPYLSHLPSHVSPSPSQRLCRSVRSPSSARLCSVLCRSSSRGGARVHPPPRKLHTLRFRSSLTHRVHSTADRSRSTGTSSLSQSPPTPSGSPQPNASAPEYPEAVGRPH